jgi:glutathione S-transferase
MDPPDWFKEISPTGQVPLLKVDDQAIFESLVITEFIFRYLRSGLEESMSKYKERWCIKSYFNQINTF